MNLKASMDDLDIQTTISKNRLVGIWKMMQGLRLRYLGAVTSLGVSAAAKTYTYLLLRYFVDAYFVSQEAKVSLPYIALGFVALALVEGGFSFLSSVLATSSTSPSRTTPIPRPAS